MDSRVTAEIGDENDEQSQPVSKELQAKRRRLRQDEIFQAFLKSSSFVYAEGESDVKRDGFTKDEREVTLNQLLATQDGQRIIGSERGYQIDIFEMAKEKNTIAVLDTGAGKTLIAILLIKHFMEQEIIARERDMEESLLPGISNGRTRRVVFFVVDKVILMYQQFHVLKANLFYNMIPLCGDMNADIWEAPKWKQILQKNDIIVCTADILSMCILRGFIQMDQISLLIFDEAHHAKLSHPYARIVRDGYVRSSGLRPRIFGMTASPVAADKGNKKTIESRASFLEELLDCEIATTVREDIAPFVHLPKEEVIFYDPPPIHSESPLCQALRRDFMNFYVFNTLLETGKIIAGELGPWCGDLYWVFAIGDKTKTQNTLASHSILRKLQRSSQARSVTSRHKITNQDGREAEALSSLKEHMSNFQIRPPALEVCDLSSKVIVLFRTLKEYFEERGPNETRCLIFVERRMTARILRELFARYLISEIPSLRPGMLIGSQSNQLDGLHQTIKSQFLELLKFRKGEVNCLFATSVAEEGLDVPSCNLIIRFDPCKTMIQYIQSRGRARQKDSRFIDMLADVPKTRYWDLQDLRHLREAEKKMRAFCLALPADRQLGVRDETDVATFDNGSPRNFFALSGACLTYPFSLVVLNHYVATLPADGDEDMTVNFTVWQNDDHQFQAEVVLPQRSKLDPARGLAYPRKILAKMSAAYEACKVLKREGRLDGNFLPAHRKQLHHMTGARLALTNSARGASYDTLIKPTFWNTHSDPVPPNKVWVNILILAQGWETPTSPFALLTRKKLPQLPKFPFYALDGTPYDMKVIPFQKPFKIEDDDDVLRLVTDFTGRIFKDIYNKTFDLDMSKMPYWLAPALYSGSITRLEQSSVTSDVQLGELLDLDLLKSCYKKQTQEWHPDTNQNPDQFVNKFLIDPWHGGRRFFTTRLAPQYKPFDQIPAEVIRERFSSSKADKTIVEFSSGRTTQSKSRQTWNMEQPVLAARGIIHRLNVLAAPSEIESATITACFVCPEPLLVSQLPVPVVNMGLLFPATIHRIEEYLIVQEYLQEIKLDLPLDLALEALTKNSSSEMVNHDAPTDVQIDIKSGMGPNYERLENLGDSFLKMATTIAVYINTDATKDEFWMHCSRMVLLCNGNLFSSAKALDIPKYIRSQNFSRRSWYPPGLTLQQGKDVSNSSTQKVSLGDKTIADICEATIGAAYIANVHSGYGDTSDFDAAVSAVTTFAHIYSNKGKVKHDMQTWSDYRKGFKLPEYVHNPCNAADLDRVQAVFETIHDYKFRYPQLLLTALTHPSMPRIYCSTPNYQRLEFLGDALVDMVAVDYLFRKYPGKDPGWLTEHKMAMVSNRFLGTLSATLGFQKMVILQSATVERQMRAFVMELLEDEMVDTSADEGHQDTSTGAAPAPVKGRDFWTTIAKDPPKILPDLVEAYVGAMFLDSDLNYGEVQRFFDRHMQWYFEDMSIYDSFANNHPVAQLERLMKTSKGCHGVTVKSQDIPAGDEYKPECVAVIMVHDTIIASAKASSSRHAKVKAGKRAMEELSASLEDTSSEGRAAFQERVKCDCKGTGEGKDGVMETHHEDGRVTSEGLGTAI